MIQLPEICADIERYRAGDVAEKDNLQERTEEKKSNITGICETTEIQKGIKGYVAGLVSTVW